MLRPYLEVFCHGGDADLRTLDLPGLRVNIHAAFSRQQPDALIAKDPATERAVLRYQMGSELLAAKLVDFDLFSSSYLLRSFSGRVADARMHVQRKCTFHCLRKYEGGHCALGDAYYLAGVYAEWAAGVL